ncbi:hypothetical protein STENM327S_03231 [Streptomyces tendae]
MAVRARLLAEFLANVDRPGTRLEDMSLASADRCQWRCSNPDCSWEWETQLRFRSRRLNPTGCPACFKRRNRAPGPGESLAEQNEPLTQQFRRNLTRPDRSPGNIRPQSHDQCEWECPQHHFFKATVANRTNGRGCPECSGHGRSLFECKVAMLVRVASGLEVELDHRLRLPGRGEDRIDLYLPQVPLMIDLDPAWSHKNQSSQARDAAKTRALRAAGQDFERIRERGLPPVPIDGLAHHKAGPGVDAEDWAAVIGSMLRQRGLPWKDLDSEQINTAFEAANQLWQKVIAGPAVTALNVAPHLEAEFVANRTNPGRGLDRMPPGSNDLCAWRCLVADCGYECATLPCASRAPRRTFCRASRMASASTSTANSRPGPVK